MCFGFKFERRPHRPRRRRSTFQPGKGSLSSIKRLVVTSTLISPNRRVNSNLIDAPDNERDEFLVFVSDVIQKHLRRVYDQQKASRSSLTKEEFATFLKETQYNAKELSAKPLGQETYEFTQFLWTWYRDYGWRAMRKPAALDTSKPISHYFINSSHNTYLEGNQWSSPSTAKAYRFVLKRDCRCIEIDVWNGEAAVRTPSRSRSPHVSSHVRQFSTPSLPSAAVSVVDAVKEALSGGQNHHHHRKSSTNPPGPGFVPCARESAVSLGPESAKDCSEKLRASSRSSARSREEPIVMHGYTLTSPVGFREVCQVIRETAFETNNLPIIVSLQVGATKEQQEVMVKVMKEEWEGLLLDQPFENCDPRQRQPRLDELLKKILVKVKRAPEKPSMPSNESTGESSLAPPTIHESIPAGFQEEDLAAAQRKKGKNEPICKNLGALAIYTHSEHFESLDASGAKLPGHIFSLSESTILKLHQTKRQEVLAHNSRFMMRAYPNPRRVLSSNPDPSLFWRRGVQMVAMNWQSLDEGMMLNYGMFAGEKGWVLKPEGYRYCDQGTCPAGTQGSCSIHSPLGMTGLRRTLNLRITFFAGQRIPLPKARIGPDGPQGDVGGPRDRSFRPYIKCELHVEKENEPVASIPVTPTARESEYKRKTRPSETDSPDFGKNGEVVEFQNVDGVIEALSFVRIKIEDDSPYYRGTLAAWTCIRLDRLRHGYRFIELLDANSNPTEGKLFVRVEKTMK